jgi:Right handed beta helix region/Purple acid Phosphatase, N-terminal domain/Pel9A-like, right handed beta helix region
MVTMGETNVLSADDSGNGSLLVAQSATLSTSATLQTLSFYVTTAGGNLRLGVYDATGPSGGPGNKKAETNEFAPSVGWNTASVTTPVALSAGTYWIAYLPSSNTLAFKKASTAGVSARYYSYSYAAMPVTFLATPLTTTSHWSFFAMLDTSGSPGPTPSPTPTPGPTPTPTPDTTPPVISGVSSSGVTSSGATITWTTNEASDTQVEYGTTTSYGSSTALNTSMLTSHFQALNGLSASTLYHYRVKSRDAAGNLATSGDFTFTTSSASQTSGASYYVATTGNDSNPGSLAQPFRTLSKGVSVLHPGDTLFVRAGTYVGLASKSGNPTIPAGTSWTNPVTVKNYPGESVTITSGGEFCLPIEGTSYVIIDGLILDGTGALNCAKIRFGANHIRLINVEAKNSTYSGILLPDESPGNTVQGYNEFINLKVHDNGTRARYDHGIYLSVPFNLVENSEFYNNAAFGIQMDQGTSANNTIRYNRVHDNSRLGSGDDGGGIVVADGENNFVAYNLVYNNGAGDGIFVAYGAVDAKIYNNTCVGNKGYFYTGTRGEVRNNIFTAGLRLELTTNLTATNNLTNVAIQRVSDGGTTLGANLVGGPQFVNSASIDFHLLSTSPAINAGTSVGLTRDFDGNPIFGAPDIGAYEFQP